MIIQTLSRRAALGGLLMVPAFSLVCPVAAAPMCGGLRSGAVQASGASTVSVARVAERGLLSLSVDGLSYADLDLQLRAPSGRLHYPWRLDPKAPPAAAENCGRERSAGVLAHCLNTVDNVEVVDVAIADAEEGEWTIMVTGRAIANAQSFALATYGLLDEETANGLK